MYSKILLLLFFVSYCQISAQFVDEFNYGEVQKDSLGRNGWAFRTGDGEAKMDFTKGGNGYASIFVDATNDKLGIWWAFIRRLVSGEMDLSILGSEDYELRVEARIKVSSAPKRVNLHLNTQRTTDFHSHLIEFDIPDTSNWHIISMTTKNFDAVPGDFVFAQMALMDWGQKKYRVDVDYFKVDLVNTKLMGPDLGSQIEYHPEIPFLEYFNEHLPAFQNGIIDSSHPDKNFGNWYSIDNGEKVNLLSTGGSQIIILRWDFDKFKNKKIVGPAILELNTFSVERSSDFKKDFGIVRIVEILNGDNNWLQSGVTFNSFSSGKDFDNEVLNSQMVIDFEVNEIKSSKSFFTIPNPVLKRMIEGKTKGLAVMPLGAIYASFYSNQIKDFSLHPKLHFNCSD